MSHCFQHAKTALTDHITKHYFVKNENCMQYNVYRFLSSVKKITFLSYKYYSSRSNILKWELSFLMLNL